MGKQASSIKIKALDTKATVVLPDSDDIVANDTEEEPSKLMAVEDLTVNTIKEIVNAKLQTNNFPAKLQLSKPLYTLVDYMWQSMPHLVGGSNNINTINRAVNNKHEVKWLTKSFGECGIKFVVPVDSRLKFSMQPDQHYHPLEGTTITFARWEIMFSHVTLHCVNPTNIANAVES
jgi:hypothetical protein